MFFITILATTFAATAATATTSKVSPPVVVASKTSGSGDSKSECFESGLTWGWKGIFNVRYGNNSFIIDTAWKLDFSTRLEEKIKQLASTDSEFKMLTPGTLPQCGWYTQSKSSSRGVHLFSINVQRCINCIDVGPGADSKFNLGIEKIQEQLSGLYPSTEIGLIVGLTIGPFIVLSIIFGIIASKNA